MRTRGLKTPLNWGSVFHVWTRQEMVGLGDPGGWSLGCVRILSGCGSMTEDTTRQSWRAKDAKATNQPGLQPHPLWPFPETLSDGTQVFFAWSLHDPLKMVGHCQQHKGVMDRFLYRVMETPVRLGFALFLVACSSPVWRPMGSHLGRKGTGICHMQAAKLGRVLGLWTVHVLFIWLMSLCVARS